MSATFSADIKLNFNDFVNSLNNVSRQAQLTAEQVQKAFQKKMTLDLDLKQAKLKLDELEKKLKVTTDATKKAKLEIDISKAKLSIDKIESSIKHLDNSLKIDLPAPNTSKFEGGLNKLKGLIGASLGVAALVSFGKEVIETGNKMETMTARIRTLGGESKRLANDFKDLSIKMSKDIPISAVDMQTALYDALSAGIQPSVEGMEKFMTAAGKLAVGGMESVGNTVNLLSSLLNAYGESADQASKYSDILFQTVNLGKTTIPELNASLSQVIPTASAAGVKLEDVGASLALMTANGIPTAQATTKLNALLTELQKGSAQLNPLLKASGVSLESLKNEPLVNNLEKLKTAFDNSGKAATQVFGSIEASAAFNTLTKDIGKSKEFLDAMSKSAGATEAAFQDMASTPEMAIQKLKVSLEGIFLTLYNALAPTLNTVVKLVSNLLEVLTPLIQEIGKSLKPIIEALLPPLTKLISTIVTKLVEFLPRLLDLLAPILEIVGSMLDILTPLIEVYLDVLLDIMKDLMVTLTPILKDLSEMIKELMPDLIPLLKLAMEGFLKLNMLGLKGAVELFKILEPAIRAVIPVLTDVIKFVADLLTGLLKFFGLVDNKTKDIKKDKKELSKTEVTPTGDIKTTDEEINKILKSGAGTKTGTGKGGEKPKPLLLSFIGDEKDLKEALDKQKKMLDDFTSSEDFGMFDNKKAEESLNNLVNSTDKSFRKINDSLINTTNVFDTQATIWEQLMLSFGTTSEELAKTMGTIGETFGDFLGKALTGTQDSGHKLISMLFDIVQSAGNILLLQYLTGVLAANPTSWITFGLSAEATYAIWLGVFNGLIGALRASIGFKEGVIDLQGAGTETSDSIMARLSKHETVMPAWWTNIPENKDYATWSLANKGLSIFDYVANMDMFGKRKENSDLRNSKSRTTNMLIAHQHKFSPFKIKGNDLYSVHRKTTEDEIKTW